MRNPSLEAKWRELYLTSVDAEELRFAERIETRQLWHKEMEKYRDDVAAWDERVKIVDAHQREPFEKAKKLLGPNGYLWRYGLADGDWSEYGWMITEDGKIIGRIPILSGRAHP